MAPKPVALTPALPSELLTYILEFDSQPVHLIICQKRDRFLHSLHRSINDTHAEAQTSEDDTIHDQPESSHHEANRKRLLTPTIHQVLMSRRVNLIFVNSLSHLRAYLAGLRNGSLHNNSASLQDSSQGVVMIYGLLELHRDTTEWSAQGLGHTLASIVEIGFFCQARVLLNEEWSKESGGDGSENDPPIVIDEISSRRQGALEVWNEEVPILSGGSTKKVVEGAWSGRKVEVGRILKRWCRFERGPWDQSFR